MRSQLTTRQADILRLVLTMGRPNVNDLIRGRQSPSRLKENLETLVDERCLQMDREGNQHRYKITRRGLRSLLKYDEQAVGGAIGSLERIRQLAPNIFKELDARVAHLELAVKMLEEASGLRVSIASGRGVR